MLQICTRSTKLERGKQNAIESVGVYIMIYERTLRVPQDVLARIQHYLEIEPECESDCFGEDDTISYTAVFDHGYEMDIKCCGVHFEAGVSNTAWCEAVLFHNGSECTSTLGEDSYLGDWELAYAGNVFLVHVLGNENTVNAL